MLLPIGIKFLIKTSFFLLVPERGLLPISEEVLIEYRHFSQYFFAFFNLFGLQAPNIKKQGRSIGYLFFDLFEKIQIVLQFGEDVILNPVVHFLVVGFTRRELATDCKDAIYTTFDIVDAHTVLVYLLQIFTADVEMVGFLLAILQFSLY